MFRSRCWMIQLSFPGTGKTLLARAVASQLDCNFLKVSIVAYSALGEPEVNQKARSLTQSLEAWTHTVPLESSCRAFVAPKAMVLVWRWVAKGVLLVAARPHSELVFVEAILL